MSNWRTESRYLGLYLGAGLFNTLIGFAVIFLLMWLGTTPFVANICGYAVGFLLGFVLSRTLVFRSNGRFVSESVRYLLAFFLAFFANLAMLAVSLYVLEVPSVLAQVIAAGTYTALMYLMTRYFVFRLPAPTPADPRR